MKYFLIKIYELPFEMLFVVCTKYEVFISG